MPVHPGAKARSAPSCNAPRFLAISEFGPRSLIYHEGRAYRVVQGQASARVRAGDGDGLATKDTAASARTAVPVHDDVTSSVAMPATPPWPGQNQVQNARCASTTSKPSPAERITANDEERVRQGFDIQTVFSWPRRDGRRGCLERPR
ncbi:MAG: hypothetical protein V9G19_08625 [Tetrasphaera sp.]